MFSSLYTFSFNLVQFCSASNENATQNGLNFLIDIEKYTMQRFGTGDGIVDWACLNCN